MCMATKNTFCIARVTPEEKKEYSEAARKMGISLGELIRILLRGYVEGKRILR